MTLALTDLKREFTEAGRTSGGVFGVDLEVGAGEFFTLLGPSGCGKTTTLRCIAGLEDPTGGRITLDGRPLYDAPARVNVPMQRREIGMVFQSYAVWPHMSVFENAAYPLRFGLGARLPAAEIRRRVMAVLEAVGLAAFAERPAPKLSGGQQQRLALARALVHRPKVLLLDEPLSNLDAALRDQMRREIRHLQRDADVTTIYVTHDQSEALALSDRIAVLREGRVEQVGDPRSIYHRPASAFVARFIGLSNAVPCGPGGAEGEVRTACGPLRGRRAGGETVPSLAIIRPEDIRVNPTEVDLEANHLPARVAGVAFMGEVTEYEMALAGGESLTVRSAVHHLAMGEDVALEIAPAAVALF